MSNVLTLSALIADAQENGGGTYSIERHHNRTFITKCAFGSGFYVATEDNELVISPEEFDESAVLDYIVDHIDLLAGNWEFFSQVCYLGIWVAESGRVYLDVTEHISEEHHAIAIGSIRGQLAIWDIAAQEEISTANSTAFALSI